MSKFKPTYQEFIESSLMPENVPWTEVAKINGAKQLKDRQENNEKLNNDRIADVRSFMKQNNLNNNFELFSENVNNEFETQVNAFGLGSLFTDKDGE